VLRQLYLAVGFEKMDEGKTNSRCQLEVVSHSLCSVLVSAHESISAEAAEPVAASAS
jgi:hypothetical protein